MSLLNDALRKHHGDQMSGDHPGDGAVISTPRSRRPKMDWRQALIAATILAVGAGALWWLLTPAQKPHPRLQTPAAVSAVQETADTSSTSVATLPNAGPADEEEEKPAGLSTASAAPAPARVDAPAAVSTQPTPTAAPATPDAANATPKNTSTSQKTSHTRIASTKAPKAGTKPMPADSPTVTTATTTLSQKQRAAAERFYRKALTYHRQERIAEAIVMYREVLKIDPDHFDAAFNLTCAYLQQDAYTNALAMASDLYRKAPANPRVGLNLAIAQIGCGRPAEALELLDHIAALPDPPLYEIFFHKGVACRNLGRADEAVKWYIKAEAFKPNDPRLLFNMAVALDQQQQYRQAVDYYSRFLKQSPDLEVQTRKRVAQRIRALRADLAINPDTEGTSP